MFHRWLTARSLLMLLGGLLLVVAACSEGPRKRPFGYLHVGLLTEFQAPETRRWDLRLIVRHDERGFSVMSTESTSDLAPLSAVNRDGREILISKFDKSTFALDGTVLTEPAKFPLPYYQLELGQGKYGGRYDSLYAKIGTEVSKDWRLKIPQQTTADVQLPANGKPSSEN